MCIQICKWGLKFSSKVRSHSKVCTYFLSKEKSCQFKLWIMCTGKEILGWSQNLLWTQMKIISLCYKSCCFKKKKKVPKKSYHLPGPENSPGEDGMHTEGYEDPWEWTIRNMGAPIKAEEPLLDIFDHSIKPGEWCTAESSRVHPLRTIVSLVSLIQT